MKFLREFENLGYLDFIEQKEFLAEHIDRSAVRYKKPSIDSQKFSILLKDYSFRNNLEDLYRHFNNLNRFYKNKDAEIDTLLLVIEEELNL